MSIPYYQVDAFTSHVFAGNPAGVCVLAEWLPDELMLSIAAENNLSETAFVVPRGEYFDLRWFTPAREVDLCGHATLATAHVVMQHLGYRNERLDFETCAGRIAVQASGDLMTLDLPTRAGERCQAPQTLIDALGAEPHTVIKSRDYMAVFESEDDVLNLSPNMTLLKELDCLGVIATAPGHQADFVSRFFAPGAGVPEDPVCGSAHCTLIPYWAEQLDRSQLWALQVSQRGGELSCEHRGERVAIGGRAVTYSTGFLHVASA
ncbi:PhzF family phenazine biosynthesis protein [Aeoliella mucimassa]|uniref:Putative isomerase YddE n=1 Tax=Aeoliella mucimassa TaxID=2527972 RepID=A0A518AHS8_9BACT|nr:PhzF family phenazine biosynthesis protein [Aeoliella mucimassa]QDU54277.1 putative isomerase YddE [Aeoliella mucimassa]